MTMDIAEILGQRQDGEGFVTVSELQERTGHSRNLIMKRLHAINASGGLEVSMVTRLNIAGLPCRKPGYRLSDSSK